MEKSNEFARRGAERTKVREHPRTYKDIVANFSSSILVYLFYIKFIVNNFIFYRIN
nr:palindromic element RPE5 domain-containing protein [Rickettsia akari]